MRDTFCLRAFALGPILALCLGPNFVMGQEGDGIRLLDTSTYLEMETVSGPQISPDGRHVLFTRGWIDKMEDRTRSNLWIADTDGSRVRQLTNGTWSDFSPAWSPDGERIAFLSDRDGSTQIHVLWLDTRETAQLTHLEHTPGALHWSPDGRTLAFGMRVPDTDPILPVRLPEYPRGARLAPPAKVIDRIIFAYDGRGDLPRGDVHLFTLDAEAGGTPKRLTPLGHSYNDPRGFEAEVHWSRDGDKLYFVAWLEPWSQVELEINESEIYSMELRSGETMQLTDRQGRDRGMELSPDGEWIAYTGFDDQDYADGNISSLYLMDSSGNQKRLLAGDLPSSPQDVTWAPDNSGVYYVMSERGLANVYFVSRQGEVRPVTSGNHVLSQLTVASTGRAASVRSTPDRPGYLVTFPLDRPEAMNTLVDVNSDVLDGVRLGEVEEMWFSSPDGLDLQGWLMKPAVFDPSRKYPLLLWIHGGPYSMYSVRWNWAWQNFAALGYAVFFMNPRGSTGYGKEFVDGIKHSYPGKDFDDLMAGVDAALAKGFIDADNLFVLGGSGGGILTSYIVGQTHRFRAAAAMRPIVNYISAAGTADDPTDKYSWFVKPHWEDPLDWYERSPIASVGNVETPVLLMTGERDLRTPMGQSEEFFRALKMQGKETLLIRMPEEFHGWRRPSHRLLNQLYLHAWFEKYRSGP
ncbi:prolyl oligopeptidase family serine peptidase [Gemmatimonadota bacterium]